ncbi:OLC1v1013131C1 [Oldenlandia corymbosa var. corymbosa]|uniref:OLC1v1013131C1 n=1 Tax=Oldenlandia corymbosa var. corymbosa TaxID=529605 RepID=A0AAV1DXI6_OLDCO|nr:OLC1v1013131C1 [Oldenlandia corymbosa var. corymbosa]
MVTAKFGSSFSCVSSFIPSPLKSKGTSLKVYLGRRLLDMQPVNVEQLRSTQVEKSWQFLNQNPRLKEKLHQRKCFPDAVSADQFDSKEIEMDYPDEEANHLLVEAVAALDGSQIPSEGTGGKPGIISFYNRPYKSEVKIVQSSSRKNPKNLLWLAGPAVLVTSFIFPSLYLRRILSTIFEDSLLTDFLILFFTEAIFYCGVAIFLLLIDYLRRPIETLSSSNIRNVNPQVGHRVSSVAVLVLNLLIPMVTMGFVWPWTGPAASATLAPYLVGIVIQFAFEQYARYTKSPSWCVIPILFQVRTCTSCPSVYSH